MKLYRITVKNGTAAEYTFIEGGTDICSAIAAFKKNNWRRPWFKSLSSITAVEVTSNREVKE